MLKRGLVRSRSDLRVPEMKSSKFPHFLASLTLSLYLCLSMTRKGCLADIRVPSSIGILCCAGNTCNRRRQVLILCSAHTTSTLLRFGNTIGVEYQFQKTTTTAFQSVSIYVCVCLQGGETSRKKERTCVIALCDKTLTTHQYQ